MLFTNDMIPSNENSKMVIFADDTSLAITVPTSDDLEMESFLKRIYYWNG